MDSESIASIIVAPQMEEECPACGASVSRIEVDIGIGIQYEPAQCTQCVWQETEAKFDFIGESDDDIF